MAVPQFYSLSETAEKLGKSEDELKELVRDGKLREFRDRGQLFFKTDEVDRLVNGGSEQDDGISLDDSSVGGIALSDDTATGEEAAATTDESTGEDEGLIALSDDTSTDEKPTPDMGDSAVGASSAGGSAIGDSAVGDSAMGDSAIGASHAGVSAKSPDEDSSLGEYSLAEDSGLDLGSPDLSGAGISAEDRAPEGDTGSSGGLDLGGTDEFSIGDEEPGKLETEGDKGDTVISSQGISVFDEDEIEIDVDPMAKTHVAPSVEDQISLEGVGSGSGLLDLTRESDDTSLGAELLDEIYPGEEESTMQEDLPTEVLPGVTEGGAPTPAPTFAPGAAPAFAVAAPAAPDPAAAGFTAMMIVGVLMLGLTGTILAAAVQGIVPSFLGTLYAQWMLVAGGGIGLVFICLIAGLVMGKGGGPSEPRAKKEKKKKGKEEEPAKEEAEMEGAVPADEEFTVADEE